MMLEWLGNYARLAGAYRRYREVVRGLMPAL